MRDHYDRSAPAERVRQAVGRLYRRCSLALIGVCFIVPEPIGERSDVVVALEALRRPAALGDVDQLTEHLVGWDMLRR